MEKKDMQFYINVYIQYKVEIAQGIMIIARCL